MHLNQQSNSRRTLGNIQLSLSGSTDGHTRWWLGRFSINSQMLVCFPDEGQRADSLVRIDASHPALISEDLICLHETSYKGYV